MCGKSRLEEAKCPLTCAVPPPQLGALLQGLRGLLPLGDGGRDGRRGRGRHPLSEQPPRLARAPAELGPWSPALTSPQGFLPSAKDCDHTHSTPCSSGPRPSFLAQLWSAGEGRIPVGVIAG